VKGENPLRILLVDDEPALRELLRVTFESADVLVEEAGDTSQAEERIRVWGPDVIVLDLRLPGEGGAEFCARLKADPATRDIPIVMLTGAEPEVARRAQAAGAEALVHKPFSPLELLALVERLVDGVQSAPTQPRQAPKANEELLFYARDLRHLLEVERRQRDMLQQSYLDTVSALAAALESKDTGTSHHSQRVQRYALELLRMIDADLLEREPAIEYGFLLHDIGKIGVPDEILQKPGPLTPTERERMQSHTVLGEQMLSGIKILHGEAVQVVRSHHERWDGRGYPDRLRGNEIPLCARVFAVADALDAMTSNRPYRRECTWEEAHAEIFKQAGHQFDPLVVQAFAKREDALRAVQRQLAVA
jgi:cyclic di-GMP phosphodiesterase